MIVISTSYKTTLESGIYAARHQEATVLRVVAISRNIKYAIMSGFCKSGHIHIYGYLYTGKVRHLPTSINH